jgi:deoxyribonuclease-4
MTVATKGRALRKPRPEPAGELLVGAHLSIAGGLHRAFERGRQLGCRALQIFTKSARGWKSTPLGDEEVRLFRAELAKGMEETTAAHASYLINLAAPAGEVGQRSQAGLIDELERCEALGLRYLVIHPGAHLGAEEQVGVERVAAMVDQAHRACAGFRVRILLENTAGQGSCLGHRFEHLAAILARVEDPGRLGVCLDTCHAFAAGYDLRTEAGYESMMGELGALVGLERLRVVHVNDAKKGLGSRVDRHEHLGKGEIGLTAFRCLVRDPRLREIPKILETPKGPDMKEDVENLAVLRGLAAG